MGKEEQRLEIVVGDRAARDFRGIWEWNSSQYGIRRADAYVDLLYSAIVQLSINPKSGRSLSKRNGFRFVIVKKSRAKASFGHVIIFRIESNRLEVLHVFHTAQDWRTKFEED